MGKLRESRVPKYFNPFLAIVECVQIFFLHVSVPYYLSCFFISTLDCGVFADCFLMTLRVWKNTGELAFLPCNKYLS